MAGSLPPPPTPPRRPARPLRAGRRAARDRADSDPRPLRAARRPARLPRLARGDDEPALLGAHLGAEPPARGGEAVADPLGILARRQPRVTELQHERHGLDPHRSRSAELDEEEQAEVVAQLAVDSVVVEEVAEVVQDR